MTLIWMAMISMASAKTVVLSFEVKHDPTLFMKVVARSCLSSPDSRIENAGPNQLKVTDKSGACAQEIKDLAVQWDTAPSNTAAVFAKPAKKAAVANRLVEKFKGAVAVTASGSCPCVILRGENATEA